MMSEYTAILAQIVIIVTCLVTVIISPFIMYLVWAVKDLSKRLKEAEDELDTRKDELDKAHHRNFRVRILLNKLTVYIRAFCDSAYEVLEVSRDTQQPVTDRQIQRLRNTGSIDDILKEDK